MKIIFNCHTEGDLKNRFGKTSEIKASEQSFSHVKDLTNWLNNFQIPIVYSLAVAGPFKDNLLKYIKEQNIRFFEKSELAIHWHSEDFRNNEWQADSFLMPDKYLFYFNKFREILGFSPGSMVFGKWRIDENNLFFLNNLGIIRDGSLIDDKMTIRAPFIKENILEIPSVAYNGKSANPFNRFSRFFLIRKIIEKYHKKNVLLQISFHSYDFFNFNNKSKMRKIKKFIFRNFLKLIKKYNLEIITLRDVDENNFDNLENIRLPFAGKLFNLIKH